MKYTSQDIIAILKTVKEVGYRRFHIESNDFLLEVDMDAGNRFEPSRGNEPQSVTASAPVSTAETTSKLQSNQSAVQDEVKQENGVAILAPMSGTFYSAPSPQEPPFVEIGSLVNADDIIEVMKLFNSIPAGISGKVVGLSARNEDSVTLNQPLIWIESSQ